MAGPRVHLTIDLDEGQVRRLDSPFVHLSPLPDAAPPSPAPLSPLPPTISSLSGWLEAQGFLDLSPVFHQVGITSLPQLLALDDAGLHAAGVKPMGRRKTLLRALRLEAGRHKVPLRGRAAFAQYIGSLLEQTSCHLLFTARTRPPHLTSYPARYHRLRPLHPLDTAALFVHRLSHSLSAADLAPYTPTCLPELVQVPLIALMEGNARVVERVAEAERLIGLKRAWAMLAAEEEDCGAGKEDKGEDAAVLMAEARRLARLTREDEAERRKAASLTGAPPLHGRPQLSPQPSPLLSASPLPPASPSLSPLPAFEVPRPPSLHPSSVQSLFNSIAQGQQQAGTGSSARGLRMSQPKSPAPLSPAAPLLSSSSLYPAVMRA